MRYENVELHNVAEVHRAKGTPGVRLQRVPEAVRTCLNPGAQARMLQPANAEIRFVAGEGGARVTVCAPAEACELAVFHGMFQSDQRYVVRGETAVETKMPERLMMLEDPQTGRMPFHPRVTRLVMGLGGPVHLCGIEGGEIRPPRPEELPSLRYLAYGTSITHGASASGLHLCYAAQTARRLGADLINLGVGGACHAEGELADYIAGRGDWHVATLALSVNMVAGFAPDAFYERVSYMVNAVCGADPNRPVGCITLFPHFRDCANGEDPAGPWPEISEQYREKLREAVAACPHPNAHLIEGPEILTDIEGLKPDLVHPGDIGMIQMGENLAVRLLPLLGRAPGG